MQVIRVPKAIGQIQHFYLFTFFTSVLTFILFLLFFYFFILSVNNSAFGRCSYLSLPIFLTVNSEPIEALLVFISIFITRDELQEMILYPDLVFVGVMILHLHLVSVNFCTSLVIYVNANILVIPSARFGQTFHPVILDS